MTADAGWQPGTRSKPQVDALGFDTRLLTAERLLQLAGFHQMQLSETGLPMVYLDCIRCKKAIEVLTDRSGGRYRITARQLLENTLRHLVMRHDLSLAGGNGDASAHGGS